MNRFIDDTSDKSIRSGTYQKDERGQMRPVSLLSTKLNPVQQRYLSNEKVVLVVIIASKYNKQPIPTETPIYLYSDNLTSVFFKSLAEKTGR